MQRETSGVRWWTGVGASTGGLGPELARLLEAVAREAGTLKQGRRKALYRLPWDGSGTEVLVKVSRYERGASRLRRLRRSKARRELRVAAALAARGIAVPVPLAAGESRRRGLLQACYLVVPVVPGATDLPRRWATGSPAERRALARGLGELAHRLHEAGLLQRDFAPNNFLAMHPPSLGLLPVDFERASLRPFLTRRARSGMLATLEGRLHGIGSAARWRFLLAYAGGDRRLARSWWKRSAAAAGRVSAREWAHLRRTGTTEGRSFRRFEHGGWRGWLRRDVPDLAALVRANAALEDRGPGDAPLARGPGELWCWRHRETGARRARDGWAAAQLLWTRGRLAPRPLALLWHGGEARLWWHAEPGARPLPELAGRDAARRAALVLLTHLLARGRLDARRLDPNGVLLHPRPGAGYTARLVDPVAFRPGCARPRQARERARALLARLAAPPGTP